MKKRFLQLGLALMLSSAMMLTAVPFSAFAEEEVQSEGEGVDVENTEGGEEGEMPEGEEGEMPEEGGEEEAPSGGSVVMTSLTANNGRMIAADFPESYLPEGFHKTSVNYQNENVQVAFMDSDRNGEVVLAYLADSDGSNGDFYLCDINTANMTDYVKFNNGSKGYIIILDPEDKVAAPGGFTRAKLESGGKIVNAWQLPGVASGNDKEARELLETLQVHAASAGGASSFDFGDEDTSDASGSDESSDESSSDSSEPQTATMSSDNEEDGSRIVDANPAEFFLAYAIDNEGTVGFYLCDSAKSTYQRYVEIDENNGLVDQYKKTARTRLIIIIVLVVLLLIAIFLLVNMFLQGGFGGGRDRDDDDDVEQMRRRVSKKEQDHIRTGRKELNYLMDKDDDEDDMPRRRPRPQEGERNRRRPADGEMPRRRRPAMEEDDMPRRRPTRTSMEDEDRPVRRRPPMREDEEGAPRRRPVRPTTEDDMPRRRVRPSAEDDMMPRRRPRPAGADPAERPRNAAPVRRPSASVLDEEDFEYDYLK